MNDIAIYKENENDMKACESYAFIGNGTSATAIAGMIFCTDPLDEEPGESFVMKAIHFKAVDEGHQDFEKMQIQMQNFLFTKNQTVIRIEINKADYDTYVGTLLKYLYMIATRQVPIVAVIVNHELIHENNKVVDDVIKHGSKDGIAVYACHEGGTDVPLFFSQENTLRTGLS